MIDCAWIDMRSADIKMRLYAKALAMRKIEMVRVWCFWVIY